MEKDKNAKISDEQAGGSRQARQNPQSPEPEPSTEGLDGQGDGDEKSVAGESAPQKELKAAKDKDDKTGKTGEGGKKAGATRNRVAGTTETDSTDAEGATSETDAVTVSAQAAEGTTVPKAAGANSAIQPDAETAATEPAASAPSAGPVSKPVQKKSRLRWLKWLFVLGLVVGLVVGSIVAWEKFGADYLRSLLDIPEPSPVPATPVEPVVIHTPAPENWREPLSELETRLESRLAQLAGANRGLETGVQNELADMEVRLNSYGERIRALSTTTREDWLLAEAEYLLRLASQRLLTERQTKNALALMETADLILRDLNDPDLFPVRKVLAEDITALRMAGIVDREGLYLKLDALAGSVDQLTPLHNPQQQQSEEDASTAPIPPDSWDDRLLANMQSALRDMVNLVRIQRRDIPLEPLLSVEQEMNLRYNIRVMLEQAQLALLREEQAIYDASLAQTSEWVKRHFVPDAASTAVLAELRKLRTERVVQPLPNVTGSLSALHDYIALWHNRYPVEGRESDR